MNKIILIGSDLTILGLLIALTIPALAHGSGSRATTYINDKTWEDMYKACQNGD